MVQEWPVTIHYLFLNSHPVYHFRFTQFHDSLVTKSRHQISAEVRLHLSVGDRVLWEVLFGNKTTTEPPSFGKKV